MTHRVDASDRRADERWDRLEEHMTTIVAEYLSELDASAAQLSEQLREDRSFSAFWFV